MFIIFFHYHLVPLSPLPLAIATLVYAYPFSQEIIVMWIS